MDAHQDNNCRASFAGAHASIPFADQLAMALRGTLSLCCIAQAPSYPAAQATRACVGCCGARVVSADVLADGPGQQQACAGRQERILGNPPGATFRV